MKKKKVSNPPPLTKNKRFSPPRMSYFLVMNSCTTHRIASPYARSTSPARVHIRYTLCAPLYERLLNRYFDFSYRFVLHFALKKLLHFALESYYILR